MLPIPNLIGRLACICNLAYVINGFDVLGPFATRDDYFSASGLLAYPESIMDPSGKNACRIGHLPEGIVLAFRGTLPPFPNGSRLQDIRILGDWVRNLTPALEEVPWLETVAPDARLHSDFVGALDSIWPEVVQSVTGISEDSGCTRLYFIGHSKGGAMATIAAMRWLVEQPTVDQVNVVTFGSPRTGNQAFATFYDNHPLIRHHRFEFGFDLVPHLPLTSIPLRQMLQVISLGGIDPVLDQNYAHVGALSYVDSIGTPVADSAHLAGQRGLKLVHPFPPSPFHLITDHLVWSTKDRPGYLTSVSPPGYWGSP